MHDKKIAAENDTENDDTATHNSETLPNQIAKTPQRPEESSAVSNAANNSNTTSVTTTAPTLEVVASSKAIVENGKETSAAVGVTKTERDSLASAVNSYYSNRRSWITTERMNELRRKAQEAVKQNKTFTIRGCFNSVRNALLARGWVEKLDVHRKHIPNGVCQITYDDLAQGLPKRKPGETRRQYILKCERNIMSRFLEHMPIDFLWTNRKEKCDYIDQAKNPGMTINKFHRAPFTSKEGLCMQLKDFHWFYDEGTAEMYFPRCFNVWSPEELCEFIENYKLTACIGFLRSLVDNYRKGGFDGVFSPIGKIPFTAIEFAHKRCTEYIDSCQHNDIDLEDPPKIWEHDWDAFLQQQFQMTCEHGKILSDPHRFLENTIKHETQLLENIQNYWPQYTLDGYRNLWIVKPANKCRGRGIQLMDNLKKIIGVVNPPITSKSRYVIQKYIERPLIIHHTKFDIRQWFLITNVQPLVVYMYKESYLRFSSQEYSLTNHHESVHLTNHAIQKKYSNGKRDKRLPTENMWDCYSFQAYLRQIGKHDMWLERIYPGMRKAIIGTMLASQDNMDRRPNTFELFGADFMICEDFYPWLIEINSSPDLGATTSVTARLCPQCLEDVIKVVIDRRIDPKAELGNFELIYRQIVPPTPAYMGLNLYVKGKQIITKLNHNGHSYHHRKERSLSTSHFFRQRTALIPTISNVHKTIMPTFNATELMEKCMADVVNSSRSSISGSGSCSFMQTQRSPLNSARQKVFVPATQPTTPCPNLLRTPRTQVGVRRRSFTNFITAKQQDPVPTKNVINVEGETTTVNLKRHRSCGPCLTTTTTTNTTHCDTNEKKFKFIIKKCAIGRSTMNRDDTRTVDSSKSNANSNEVTVAVTKSVDNIVDLVRKDRQVVKDKINSCTEQNSKRQKETAKRPITNAAATAPIRSQSCFIERKHCRRIPVPEQQTNVVEHKWRNLRDVTLAVKSNAKNLEKYTDNGDANNSAVTTNAMHAIGKGMISWKTTRRSASRASTTSTANTTTSKAISAYSCKNIPSYNNAGCATLEDEAAKLKFTHRSRNRRNTKC